MNKTSDEHTTPEFSAHEAELTELLLRVMDAPLSPISKNVKAIESRLENIENLLPDISSDISNIIRSTSVVSKIHESVSTVLEYFEEGGKIKGLLDDLKSKVDETSNSTKIIKEVLDQNAAQMARLTDLVSSKSGDMERALEQRFQTLRKQVLWGAALNGTGLIGVVILLVKLLT